VAKAEKAVVDFGPIGRRQFIALDGTGESVNRDLDLSYSRQARPPARLTL
jgi:hypothetical protein